MAPLREAHSILLKNPGHVEDVLPGERHCVEIITISFYPISE
jgi:hypothetical protein